jgi:glycosyltransferase involved in cell wall biosynthesis
VRVLFLSCHSPYPPVSGGRLREHELLTRLSGEHELDLCAVSKSYEEDREAAITLRDHCRTVAVFRAAGSTPCQIARHASVEATAHVARLLREEPIDVVHVEGFYLLQHVPEPSDVPIVLVGQNVEYELWRQRVETAVDEEARRASFLSYRQTREAEVRAWRRASLCVAVTEDDRAAMRRAVAGLEVRLVPDGADHLPLLERPARRRAGSLQAVTLVGNFAYQPNADAAIHLCRDILPRVLERVRDVHVFLVGNDPPAEVRALASEHVTVTGRVRAVGPYLDAADVVVLPLRIGGGVKVKMLEALRRGKAIVTTPLGLQGLAGVEDRVRVANDPSSFSAAVADLLARPDERRRLERSALAFAATLPTWDDAADALSACYREAVSRAARRRRRSASTAVRTGSRS